MDYGKIVQLVKAGFTAEQIEILAPMFTAPEQAPTTAPEPAPAPAPEPAPAPAPEPSPAPTPTPDPLPASMAAIESAMNEIAAMLRTGALAAQFGPPTPDRGVSDILAEVVNPPRHNVK